MSLSLSRRRSLLLLGLAPLVAGTFASALQSCGTSSSSSQGDRKERQEVLRDLVEVVILPSYEQLAKDTTALVKASEALAAGPTSEKLSAAQRAFRAARTDWKQSEAFYFGPAEDIAYTGGAIDSWPADGAALDALVASDAAVDADAAARLGANLRGFPGIEHLLFDSTRGDEVVLATLTEEDLGARRLTLLVSLCRDLAKKCENVRAAWVDGIEGGPGYGHELAEAGEDSRFYDLQREGIDEVVTGMLHLAELMVMSKFAKPLGVDSDGEVHPELEEAPRSDGTLDALRDNLLGLTAVYECKRGDRKGHSLSDTVKKANASVDDRFRQALKDALAAVEAVPNSFRVTLVDDPAPIENAYQKVRVVKNAITMELAGALGASIGFGYSDTD